MPRLRTRAWVLADAQLEDVHSLLRQRTGSDIPTLGQLKEVVDCALSATLKPDEGRFPRFRLVLEPAEDCLDAVLIGERRLSPDAIRELAPVATSTLHIGVWPSSSDRQLSVWGATSLPPHTRLSIAAVEPGSIVLKVGFETVAFYRQLERLLTLADSEAEEVGTGVGRLHAAYLLGRSLTDVDSGWTWAFGGMLFLLVDAVRRQGHGGALLVLSGQDPPPALNIKFPALPGSRADRLMEAIGSLARDTPQDLDAFFKAYRDRSTHISRRLRPILENRPWEIEPSLNHAASAFADLAAVDGAVVLRRDLSLKGFGAVITTVGQGDPLMHQLSTLESMAGEPPTAGPVSALGGTRRRSAAGFVAANPGAAAMVVSQDGGVAVASWTLPEAPPDCPLVLRDLDLLWP